MISNFHAEPDVITCELYEQDFPVIGPENSVQSNVSGDYQCLSCNDLGISTVNFTVTVLSKLLPCHSTQLHYHTFIKVQKVKGRLHSCDSLFQMLIDCQLYWIMI